MRTAILTCLGAITIASAHAGDPGPAEPARKVERKGPLAGLPSPPGPHIDKIKALGDDQWLKLPAPAPDPHWGRAHSVTWGAKMAYARDLRGGFIYGEDQHGWVNQKTGHYYDALWFYDLNANRWICCYPGTHVASFAKRIRDGELKVDDDGRLRDRDGQPFPVAPLIHPYGHMTYDPDTHRLAVDATMRDYLSADALKEGYAAWDEQLKARNIKWQERTTSPWFYDTVKCKWEVHSAKGDRGSYFGAFEYVPSRKGYVQISYDREAHVYHYDPQARIWKRSRAAGGPNGIDASGCLDTRRDRIYYGGSGYGIGPGTKSPAENFFAYDIKTGTWKKLNLAADRWRQNMSSFQAFFHYDAETDRLVAIATPNCPAAERKIYAYDPEADRCEEPRALPPEVLEDTEGCAASSAFYDPELNAHFCFFSKGLNTPHDSVWVYRYTRRPEKK